MARNQKNSNGPEESAVETETDSAPADDSGQDLTPAEKLPATEGESHEDAADPDSVTHRLIESNLEADPSLVKPETTDPAPPPDVTQTTGHPAEAIFRNAEEQLQALLDQGIDRSDIELVTDSAGRLIEARRIEL